MIEITPDSMGTDLPAFQKITLDSNLLMYLSDLGFLDEYSPVLIGNRVNRLSVEQKVFLMVKLEGEGETPESRKKLLREHLGLSSEIEEEFQAKILDIIPE